MRVGVDLPYYRDPGEIRTFASAVEDMGYDHLGFSEHVASARGTVYPDGFSTDDPWHESFTTLGFLAAVTSRIELVPSMVLVSLRPAVLVAKQAAEIDLLSNGRLRLGVAIGWNREEVRALGFDPTTRAARFEEQIEAMRLLWSTDVVDYHGNHVNLEGVALHPRPARTIPIWFGAGGFSTGGEPVPAAVERMARLADGWKMFAPLSFDLDRGPAAVHRIRTAVAAAGRDVSTFGIETRIAPQFVPEDEWIPRLQLWKDLGVSHIGLANRKGAGEVDGELERLRRFADATRHLWK